ncbi:MAG TPA: hypothetical protein VF189_01790 [Patescibacteria group bacterium]
MAFLKIEKYYKIRVRQSGPENFPVTHEDKPRAGVRLRFGSIPFGIHMTREQKSFIWPFPEKEGQDERLRQKAEKIQERFARFHIPTSLRDIDIVT